MDIETLKALTQEDIVWLLTERADDVKAAMKEVSRIKRKKYNQEYYSKQKESQEFKDKNRTNAYQYYIEHKAERNECGRKYYIKNKEKINEGKIKKYSEKKLKEIKEAEDAVKKTKVRIIQAEQLGIPTMKTKIERKVVTPFDTDIDMKPKTDKDKLADANRELRQLDERKDQMEWEDWWRQRNIILQRIENIGLRMGKKHKVFEH